MFEFGYLLKSWIVSYWTRRRQQKALKQIQRDLFDLRFPRNGGR